MGCRSGERRRWAPRRASRTPGDARRSPQGIEAARQPAGHGRLTRTLSTGPPGDRGSCRHLTGWRSAGRVPLGHVCTERRRAAGRAERILPLWRRIRMAGRPRWDRRQRVAGRSRSWRARRGRPRSGFMGSGPSQRSRPRRHAPTARPPPPRGFPRSPEKGAPGPPGQREESRRLEDRPLRGAEPRPPLRSWRPVRPVRALQCRTLKVPKPWSSMSSPRANASFTAEKGVDRWTLEPARKPLARRDPPTRTGP